MSLIRITTADLETGETLIIAEGTLGEGVVDSELGFYFDPELVNTEILQENQDRKLQDETGAGRYFDVISPLSRDILRTEAAWLYDDVQPGLEAIRGLYGFSKQDAEGVLVHVISEESGEEEDGRLDEELGAALDLE